jgi:hypothetical protein
METETGELTMHAITGALARFVRADLKAFAAVTFQNLDALVARGQSAVALPASLSRPRTTRRRRRPPGAG